MSRSLSRRLRACSAFSASATETVADKPAESGGSGRLEGRQSGSRKAVCSGRSTTLDRTVGMSPILSSSDWKAGLSGRVTGSYATPSALPSGRRQQPPPQHRLINWAVDSPVMRCTSAAFWAMSRVEARLRRGSGCGGSSSPVEVVGQLRVGQGGRNGGRTVRRLVAGASGRGLGHDLVYARVHREGGFGRGTGAGVRVGRMMQER